MRDVLNTIKKENGFVAAVITADATGITIDRQGFGVCGADVVLGNSGDTLSGSVYVELEAQESVDDSTWTACADASIMNAVTGTNTGTFAVVNAPAEDSTVFSVQYRGGKRYFRVVANVTGTHTNGIPFGVVNWKGEATYKPV